MSRNLTLHPKHGLNPTMSLCFWCGNETGEIVMLGNAFKGEAPRTMVLGYNPCPSCAKNFATGVTIIEVSDRPLKENQPPMDREGNAYPTGRLFVVNADSFSESANLPADRLEAIRKVGMCFMTVQDFSAMYERALAQGVLPAPMQHLPREEAEVISDPVDKKDLN